MLRGRFKAGQGAGRSTWLCPVHSFASSAAHRGRSLIPQPQGNLWSGLGAQSSGNRRPARCGSVSIGTTNAAQHWLMPRLGDFWNAHQDIIITHMIDRAQDLFRADVDLRVRHGDAYGPTKRSSFSTTQSSRGREPELRQVPHVQLPRDLATHPLLSVEGTDWTWTTWPEFLRQVSLISGSMCGASTAMSLPYKAAQDGQGIALGWRNLIKPLLERRKLVQVSEAGVLSAPAPSIFAGT